MLPGQWLIHVNSPELWVFMQTKYDWIISSRRELVGGINGGALLTSWWNVQQSAEYFCSLEHRLKRFPCLGEAGKQSELAFFFVFLFFCCSGCSRIMHDGNGDAIYLFIFYCILHRTHLESFRDFNSLHSASDSAKTKQKEKVWRIVSNVSPKRRAANANDSDIKTIAEPREQQVVPARRCRVFFYFIFEFGIYYFYLAFCLLPFPSMCKTF